jgi:hypothetical protein
MKKPYTFRLDINLIKQLDLLQGNRTFNITNAISSYLQNGKNSSPYDIDVVHILQAQVQDLKQDKSILQERLDYYMLPWYHRLLLPPKKL